ncbi:LysE family translocator [Nocardia carnea]|uniref:LysE family translocator n=1 Tax=Nocardia carnea TaxID=37328 RepID=UPI0024589331|nr:LysE family translocator [Nocardia carnea]
MPTGDALLTFGLASLVLIVIPGPSVLFVIGRSLSLGRKGGLLSVLGNEVGGLVPICLVAGGVGSIVAKSIVLFTIVKVFGALYLTYLGIQAIRHRRDGIETPDSGVTAIPPWRVFGEGVLVGATNPKTIVFFVAVLPQFVDFHAGRVPLQMMVLGAVFTAVAFACDSVWALLAGAARGWFSGSPRRLSVAGASGGAMMIGLGGTLLFADNRQ